MNVQIGLDVKGSEEVSKVLNQYLANLHVLYTKLHNYHWNVEGKSFFQLHAKLEELYNNTAEELDAVAERILTLGFRPAASMKEYLDLATLNEVKSEPITGEAIVKDLQKDFETLIAELRTALKTADQNDDQVTVDLFVGSIGNLEKTLWMFRAYLS
ncbi:DNA starvation/stationary phase protection protein [Alkaliphilus sp. MSJ-5]|uniref:DNA starvation/stationary phase protection protein n=1 Tax=Alkaliphilus flagellatus TaxID=2841507 RepID=A0ABS6G9W3_9FIRM|nr:DNA starvation/stationary phase protection protein [Alkaliphilus flagellatus]MBU5678180.1 DNA starvation/stationary phase protection protein [Alkaliphilus flagellatus]